MTDVILRDETECCEVCRFWCRLDEHNGQCRRFPPQVFEIGPLGASQPSTFDKQWCGEFERATIQVPRGS